MRTCARFNANNGTNIKHTHAQHKQKRREFIEREKERYFLLLIWRCWRCQLRAPKCMHTVYRQCERWQGNGRRIWNKIILSVYNWSSKKRQINSISACRSRFLIVVIYREKHFIGARSVKCVVSSECVTFFMSAKAGWLLLHIAMDVLEC